MADRLPGAASQAMRPERRRDDDEVFGDIGAIRTVGESRMPSFGDEL